MKRSFWHSWVAVLAGNVIHFAVKRFLPARAQHQMYQVDWGLAIDLGIRLASYGLLRMIR
jgi:hypothetical protein